MILCTICGRYHDSTTTACPPMADQTVTTSYSPPPRQGWQCPFCQTVYAPWVMKCTCSTVRQGGASISTTETTDE